MDLDWGIVPTYLPFLLRGALVTVEVCALSIAIATVAGLLMAFLRSSRIRIVRWAVGVYVWVIRGTPLLVILFFMYYALPHVGVSLSAFVAAVTGMSINATAYKCEIFRSGIEAVPADQRESGEALGMSPVQVARRIVLPQAIRTVIPPYINNAILIVKDSALVSVITVADLMMNTQQIVASTYRAFELIATAGAIYLILTSVLMLVQRVVERRLGYYRR